jgi:hypothetical protein
MIDPADKNTVYNLANNTMVSVGFTGKDIEGVVGADQVLSNVTEWIRNNKAIVVEKILPLSLLTSDPGGFVLGYAAGLYALNNELRISNESEQASVESMGKYRNAVFKRMMEKLKKEVEAGHDPNINTE